MHPKALVAAFTVLLSIGVACAADAPVSDLAVTRAAFLRVIDRPKVPLAPEEKPASEADEDGVSTIHFTYASDAEQRVPGILLKRARHAAPSGERRPVVIALHGTSGNKSSGEVLEILRAAVRAGFIGVAIDGRYHGERTKAGSGAAEYNDAIVRAWRTGRGHPFYYDTVWDVMRLIDYIETRDDVDASRIGLMGFSKGGIETYFTAAADPRIAAAVPCIGVQSFGWALDNGQWKARIATIQNAFNIIASDEKQNNPGADFVRTFYGRIVPGIDGEFDGPAMLPLIAPRPLLVINGDSDANTPVAGVRLSVDAARPHYTEQNADDRLVLNVQENTAHRVTPESKTQVVDWFVRWLKP